MTDCYTMSCIVALTACTLCALLLCCERLEPYVHVCLYICSISLGNLHVHVHVYMTHMKLGTGTLSILAGFIHVHIVCLGISNKSVAVPRQDSMSPAIHVYTCTFVQVHVHVHCMRRGWICCKSLITPPDSGNFPSEATREHIFQPYSSIHIQYYMYTMYLYTLYVWTLYYDF